MQNNLMQDNGIKVKNTSPPHPYIGIIAHIFISPTCQLRVLKFYRLFFSSKKTRIIAKTSSLLYSYS